jgi:hypothetical protein
MAAARLGIRLSNRQLSKAAASSGVSMICSRSILSASFFLAISQPFDS